MRRPIHPTSLRLTEMRSRPDTSYHPALPEMHKRGLSARAFPLEIFLHPHCGGFEKTSNDPLAA